MKKSLNLLARPARGFLGLAALAVAAPASAQELPPTLTDLLREATKQERETIENVAKRLYPDARPKIDKTIDRIEDEEKAKAGKSKFVEGWQGDGSIGGSMSSGNTDEWSVTASLDIERKGPQWEHNFDLEIALQDSEGERTEDRWSGSYRARRDFAKSPWFVFGKVRYERDRLLGIDDRFTEGAGIGYQLVDNDELDWEVNAGPALRQTRFEDGSSENRLAAFIATDFEWEITDKLTFREKAAVLRETDNTSLNSTTSITSNIYGRLSGRISFEVDAESSPPAGSEKLDTHSLLSIVFSL